MKNAFNEGVAAVLGTGFGSSCIQCSDIPTGTERIVKPLKELANIPDANIKPINILEKIKLATELGSNKEMLTMLRKSPSSGN